MVIAGASGGPYTNTTLNFGNGNNKTSTAVSTNIIIMVGGQAVGAVQNLSINETRQISVIDELGTDGHVDSAPSRSTTYKISCNRIRLNRLRIAEAFGRGFVHASSQQYPFDIVILDKQKGNIGSQISTVIKNCWIDNITVDYKVSDWIITESMTLTAENIYSFLNAGSSDATSSGNPVAMGGDDGSRSFSKIGIEQEADTGANGRRGSLDAAGLIDIGSLGTEI